MALIGGGGQQPKVAPARLREAIRRPEDTAAVGEIGGSFSNLHGEVRRSVELARKRKAEFDAVLTESVAQAFDGEKQIVDEMEGAIARAVEDVNLSPDEKRRIQLGLLDRDALLVERRRNQEAWREVAENREQGVKPSAPDWDSFLSELSFEQRAALEERLAAFDESAEWSKSTDTKEEA